MAESERSRTGDGGGAPPQKKREELDQLLQKIAAHIAVSEKAAGEAPAGPGGQPALRLPSSTAAAAKPDAPKQLAGGGPGTAPEVAPSLRRSPSIEPPVLRSAVSRQPAPTSPSHRDGELLKESSSNSEPTVMVESEPKSKSAPSTANPRSSDTREEPWDHEAAEALTRTYEADAALPPLRSMLSTMAAPPKASLAEDPAPSVTAVDHAAVEQTTMRLIDASRRVESMLATLASRDSVDSLGQRIDTVAGDVARTAAGLARLDGIEVALGELGAKLSDDQMVALFGPLVPTAEDLTRFADDAAGRAADRVLEAYAQQMSGEAPSHRAVDAVSGGELKALSDLVSGFITDSRRSDAGTQEALETLQMAMQHVLDRLEQVEGGGVSDAGSEPVSLVEQHKARMAAEPVVRSPRPAVPDHANMDFRDLAPDLPPLPQHQAHPAREEAAAMHVQHASYAGPQDAAIPRDAALEPRGSGVPGDLHHGPTGRVAPEPPQRRFTEPVPVPAPDALPLSDRQAFIAMARKAAEKAKAAADAPRAPGAGKSPGPAREPRASAMSVSATKAFAGIRPSVLIISAATLLLAGFWFIKGPKLGLPRALMPAAIEQVVEPESEPADTAAVPRSNAQPDIEEPAPAPAESKSAPGEPGRPATPRRISDDAPASTPPGDLKDARVDTAPSQAAGPGIAVTLGDRPASPEQVIQARERVRIANLSQRTAFSAARMHPVPPGASPVETSSVAPPSSTDAPSPPVSASGPQAPKPASSRHIELPPATTGPLSLRLAAAQGDASAQLEVATRLAEGKGTKQSFAEAAVWYERAAAQGEGVAQYRLGTLYERGMGVKADRETARGWYQQAADQGNLKAMHNLAVMSASPAAGTPDYTTAATLFTKAAGFGLADSQYNLGVLYESGLGVPKDHAAAYKWYTLAARGGDQDAARRRDLLIARLPPETLQAMDAQVASWRPASASERANNARVAGETWKRRAAEAKR